MECECVALRKCDGMRMMNSIPLGRIVKKKC